MAVLIRPLYTLEILAVLGVVLAASSVTFAVLVRRWTTQRRRVSMTEWGKQRGFELKTLEVSQLGPPLETLKKFGARPVTCLETAGTQIVQVVSDPPPRPDGRPGAGEVVWNLLVRRIEPPRIPAGLRPAYDRHSFLDLFSLSSFPAAGGTDRFVVYAADSEAAQTFPHESLRAMVPSDVGLLVYGDAVVLDFSVRPFDDLEFNRLTALADQLARKLKEPG